MSVNLQQTNITYKRKPDKSNYQYNFVAYESRYVRVAVSYMATLPGEPKPIKRTVVIPSVLYEITKSTQSGYMRIPNNHGVDIYFRRELAHAYPSENFDDVFFELVNIQLNMPFDQQVTQPNGYSGPTIDWAIDKIAMLAQQLDGRLLVLENTLIPTEQLLVGGPVLPINYIPKVLDDLGRWIASALMDDGYVVTCSSEFTSQGVIHAKNNLIVDGYLTNNGHNVKFALSNVQDGDSLILRPMTGYYEITNTSTPGGGSNINVSENTIAKGGPGNTVVDSNIIDDGSVVTVTAPTTFNNDVDTLGTIYSNDIEVLNNFIMVSDANMVTNGAVFGFDFVGDFDTKPYLSFYLTPEGDLKVTNTALPAVDVSAKYDSSGVLSGLNGTIAVNDILINAGTGVVWNGTTYQEVTISSGILISIPTTADAYVLLRWDGTSSLEAYTQTTPPSNTQRVEDIYLYYVVVNDGSVVNLYNRFRNLNQQLEQVIDILNLAVPYSNMSITLTNGTTKFVRNSGVFKAFGIKNIPTTTAKYDTSTITNTASNAPIFVILDVYRSNVSSGLTDFLMPPQYLLNNVLTDIPADSWGYYEVLVNAYGEVRFIYPIDVFVSIEPNNGDAQQSLQNLTTIRDFKIDGFAIIGMLGLKGGSTTFEDNTAVFYRNVAQVGGSATVVEINLPDPDNFDEGYRLTVVDNGGGNKEWYGMPDNVKASTVGQEAYFDSATTISGRDSRIKTSAPGKYAVYDSTGLALEGADLPTYTSPVKDGVVGKPAIYDTIGTVSASTGLVVPSPAAGDINKILGATSVDVVSWVEQPTFTSNVKPATIGQIASYDTDTTISGVDGLLVPDPISTDVNKVLGATGEGVVGWVDQATGGGGSGTVSPGTIGEVAIYTDVETVGSQPKLFVPDPIDTDVNKILGATGIGVVEWVDNPTFTSNVKPGTTGRPAYYDTASTVSSSTGLIVPSPTVAQVTRILGALAEDTIGWIEQPTFTSNVKPGTVGKPAYYDTTDTVISSADHLVPDPTTGDVNKVLGATSAGVVAWVNQTTGGGGSGVIKPGVIGNTVVYTATEEVGPSTNQLVTRPAAINNGQIYTALGEGVAGWRDFTGSIDNVVITKIVSDSQQAGDVLTTLSKRRLYSTGNRIYDNYSRRELLALNGQTISLKQYLGLGLKADIVEAAPQPGDEPPDPIQCTSLTSTTYRKVRFFRTPTNEKYTLEAEGGAFDTTVTGVHLGTINPKTGVITRIRTHTSWPQTGAVSRPEYFGVFFVVDVVNNYYGYNIYSASGGYQTYFYNLTTGEAGAPITTNRWTMAPNFDYGIFNGHLYVFYVGTTVLLDKILITAGATGGPSLTYISDGVSVANRSSSRDHKIKQIDEDTLLVFFAYSSSNTYYFYHITYNLSNDTPSALYQRTGSSTNFSATHGSTYYNGMFYYPYTGTNSGGNQRGWLEVGTANGAVDTNLPGNTLGVSYYDQHPKYTNICGLLKNNKSALFISYDYGETWIEKVGFNAATQFWPTQGTATTAGVTYYSTGSRTIWLDDNNTNMIFTGWLTNGGTNAPCAIQPLGVTAGEATLPTWQDGAYIVSTEFQYTPVTWFDAGGGLVIGETYHTRRMPLAKTVTSDGEITTIDWAVGTTPPSAVVGFACSDKTIGTWAVSDKSVYYAADGYSFSHVYTTAENVFINQVAYYDENRCLIATYQTDPVNTTNIALADTDGNIQVIYNVSSAYPIVSDLVVTDYYIVFSKLGVNQVVWADRIDLIFGSVTVATEIKKLASAGSTTHGVSYDGTVIYEWLGKGQSQLALRTFGGGTIINDIASEPGKLFAVGYTGVDGSAYMYNYTSWIDYQGIGTANQFNVVEISTTSVSDVIIAGHNSFFSSNDGFENQPRQLSIATGSTQPLDVKSISIDTTKAFTVFFGVDGSDQGFNYRAGDISTSIITDLLENRYNGVMVGTAPMGYVVTKKPQDDFWIRQLVQLIPGSTFTQRQTIAEGLNGAIYIQNDEGHIGVSTDGGDTYNVAVASPISESNRGGAFVGGLLANNSLMALSGGRMLKSNDDWATSTLWSPFNPDQVCTSFSRDLGRNDIVYVAVSQQGTGTNVCRVERFNASDNWTAPARLLDITLDGGRYFTCIASYNDRIVVVQSDGALRHSVNGGLTWSEENTSIIDTPAVTEGITSIWIENTTDCIYIAKTGGILYNTFVGLEIGEPWIQEDVPVAVDQQIGAHLIDKKRTMGVMGNVGVGLYWRRYDT